MGATDPITAAIGLGIGYKKNQDAKKEVKRQAKFAEEERALKQAAFNAEKLNLLKQKTSSHTAQMGANGMTKTSRSSKAYIKNIEKSIEDEMNYNSQMTSLDRKKEESKNRYKNQTNLMNQLASANNATTSGASLASGIASMF